MFKINEEDEEGDKIVEETINGTGIYRIREKEDKDQNNDESKKDNKNIEEKSDVLSENKTEEIEIEETIYFQETNKNDEEQEIHKDKSVNYEEIGEDKTNIQNMKNKEEIIIKRTINEPDNKVTLNRPHIVLHQSGSNDVVSIKKLAMKYSHENDTEKTYLYMSKLVSLREFEIPMEYAINLYGQRNFQVSLNYFELLSKYNHPIAKYFIGIMKYKGKGCEVDRTESYSILKHLSDNGFDKATEFIKDNF